MHESRIGLQRSLITPRSGSAIASSLPAARQKQMLHSWGNLTLTITPLSSMVDNHLPKFQSSTYGEETLKESAFVLRRRGGRGGGSCIGNHGCGCGYSKGQGRRGGGEDQAQRTGQPWRVCFTVHAGLFDWVSRRQQFEGFQLLLLTWLCPLHWAWNKMASNR